jgi:hypothetical protein
MFVCCGILGLPEERPVPTTTLHKIMSVFDSAAESIYSPCLKYKFLQLFILVSSCVLLDSLVSSFLLVHSINMFFCRYQKSAVSDHLWGPFQMIASSPKGSLAGVLVVYLIIVLLWLPLKLISLLVTENGTYLVMMALFYKFGHTVALYLSFPGCFKTVQV